MKPTDEQLKAIYEKHMKYCEQNIMEIGVNKTQSTIESMQEVWNLAIEKSAEKVTYGTELSTDLNKESILKLKY